MEYFIFIKWLIMLNIFITLLTLILIVPQTVLSPHNFADSLNTSGADSLSLIDVNVTLNREQSKTCTREYSDKIQSSSQPEFYWRLADFIQGTGFMEKAATLFYGTFYDKTWKDSISTDSSEPIYRRYPMGAMFLIVNFLVFAVSMIALLWSCSTHLRRSVKGAQGKFKTHSCFAVFASWEWSLSDPSAVKLKKNLIRQQLLQLTADSMRRQDKQERTTLQVVGLTITRILINVLVISLLGGSLWLIVYVQDFAVEQLGSSSNIPVTLSLLYEYLPTIVITGVYMIIPIVFKLIVQFEKYKPKLELGITIARILILRLASLGFLFFKILNQLISACETDSTNSCIRSCQTDNRTITLTTTFKYCWENYIGQQVYKLVILDLAVLLLVTLLVEFPRKLIYDKLGVKFKLIEFIGQQEFDMPKNVMDLLYNQTLCWVGVFFSPYIPLMITIKMIIFFALKRLSLFKNQKPSPTLSRSSDVYSFFLFVMLLSLLIAYITVAICVQFIEPSQGCGPFRVMLTEAWRIDKTVEVYLNNGPESVRDVIKVMRNPVIIGGLIGFLVCMIYYLSTLSTGRSAEIKLLEGELSNAVITKQFLYNQVQENIFDNNNNNSTPNRFTAASRNVDSVDVSVNSIKPKEAEVIKITTEPTRPGSPSKFDELPRLQDVQLTGNSTSEGGYHNAAFIPDEPEVIFQPSTDTNPRSLEKDFQLQALQSDNQSTEKQHEATSSDRSDEQSETEFVFIRPQTITPEQPDKHSAQNEFGSAGVSNGEDQSLSIDDVLLQRSGDLPTSKSIHSQSLGGEWYNESFENEDSASEMSGSVTDFRSQRVNSEPEFNFVRHNLERYEQHNGQENITNETNTSGVIFPYPYHERDTDEQSNDSSEEGSALDDILLQRAM